MHHIASHRRTYIPNLIQLKSNNAKLLCSHVNYHWILQFYRNIASQFRANLHNIRDKLFQMCVPVSLPNDGIFNQIDRHVQQQQQCNTCSRGEFPPTAVIDGWTQTTTTTTMNAITTTTTTQLVMQCVAAVGCVDETCMVGWIYLVTCDCNSREKQLLLEQFETVF